jgi:hypothetical protein
MPKRLNLTYPTYIVKCSWDATSLKLKIPARNEEEAHEKAWMKVSRMEGGMSCQRVEVVSKS